VVLGTVDRSAQARPGRSVRGLPAPLSTFIGRKAEVDELHALLAESRLVTLTGPGGSGKTRLALEVAANVGGVDAPAIFVDLSPITDPSLVLPTIAASLGIPAESSERSVDPLVDEIGGRRLLLVLDNLEQLPGAGPLVVDLLAASAATRILATSRAPLHVRGEHEYPVDPLALPGPDQTTSPDALARFDAIALFVDRARAIDPHFALNSRNAASVAEICRRVDGLPLAIELAAGQLKILTPDALQRRLERRLPLLTASTADAPARQRTLRDTIAWSFGLLDREDRIVFARASVFVGGFGTPDAEAVLPDPGDTAEFEVPGSLGRLVDLNLLRVAPDSEGEPRFGFLETIREFAAEKLEETEAEALRRRHASHFADLAEASIRNTAGPQRSAWVRRVNYGPDLANVRAAVGWSRERNEHELLVRLVVASPAVMDALAAGWEALGTAEVMAETADPATRAFLIEKLALYSMAYGGDRIRCRSLFSESLRLYEAVGNRGGMSSALRDLAAVAFDLGDRVAARRQIQRALALAAEVDDPLEALRLLSGITSVYVPVHPPAKGIALAQEVIDRSIALDYRPTLAFGNDFLGAALLASGDVNGAIAAKSESVRIWRQVGEDPDVNSGLAVLAVARLRAGQLQQSRELLREAAEIAQGHGVVWRGLAVLEAIADWLGATGRPDAAAVCWGAVDATRAVTRDRTICNDLGLFASSRERDRAALAPAAYKRARATGEAMSLRDALEYARRELDETVVVDPRGARAERSDRHDLTAREREVLELLATGKTDGQIAEALFISKKTAAVHVTNIKGKLGANSRVEIVTMALRRGLVPDPS
jgi:predicted ATPase/DNA-binding CsgD family transcriptional regulator/tetratricopeptide (TPR) repeat protein